ncbi:MAG: hypothetical protein HY287_10870 [Planctomycetes bacterium]|nr:hypothetical protein [Planctomycetota bacterium]
MIKIKQESRGRLACLVLAAIAALTFTGCNMPRWADMPRWAQPSSLDAMISSGWISDYEAAERRMRETSGGMLIFYKSGDRKTDQAMLMKLKEVDIDSSCPECVRCILFHNYEPDRRYAAQYGVERAPALILIHPDGTYHARLGKADVEQIMAFLKDSTPPGAMPKINPYILREARYVWLSSLSDAEKASKQTDQPIFLVLDRFYANDWSKLREMLERREVHDRIVNMVHCRPGGFWGGQGDAAKEFNVKGVPAIVIIQPDGRHDVLELPTSYEMIARFVDRVQNGKNGEASTEASAQAK